MAVMVFINPSSRPDYLVFYVPAIAALGEMWLNGERPRWALPALLLSLAPISLCTEWVWGSRDLNHAIEAMRVPVLGMMGLMALLAVMLLHPADERNA